MTLAREDCVIGSTSRTRQPFVLDDAVAILTATPPMLDAWLRHLPDAWINAHEGGDTWSAFDVVGHLVHGELTDWMPRVRVILTSGLSRRFEPFDRTAMFEHAHGKSLGDLLDAFAQARTDSLRELVDLNITAADLDRQGSHPQLGSVTLRQLLATWVAHDFDHVSQIARVLAHQYAEDVGPWQAYLRIISGHPG
jgi:hypothetical protein